MSKARDSGTKREKGFVTGGEAIGLEERGGGDRTGRIGKVPGMETSQKSKCVFGYLHFGPFISGPIEIFATFISGPIKPD